MKEELVKYLVNELSYAYCDNCGSNSCEDCHRKYQNWCLAEHTAKELIDYIDKKYNNIINYLVKWLEDEHMGTGELAKEYLKKDFDYKV